MPNTHANQNKESATLLSVFSRRARMPRGPAEQRSFAKNARNAKNRALPIGSSVTWELKMTPREAPNPSLPYSAKIETKS